MKRLLASFLALLMIVPLAACSDSADTADTTSAADTSALDNAAAEATDTERSQIKDGLPELDFEGQEIRIVHRDDGADCTIEVTSEESGDIVNEAIYNRQLAVEERLNVKLADVKVTSSIHTGADVANKIRQSVTAGSDDYDIAFNHMSQMTPLALEGMFIDLYTLEYNDFSQPWWFRNFMENATIYDRCFYAIGDASLTLIQNIYLIYYNKNIYGDFFDDDIYETVWNGDWNIELMSKLGRTVYTDNNGDSAYDVGDTYGYSTTAVSLIDALLVGADIKLSERDSDGNPYFVIGEDERTFDFIDTIYNMLIDKQLTWRVADTAQGELDMLQKFSEGTLLFIPYSPSGTTQLRSMEDDFGVLPMPKLDDTQDEYTTSAHNGFSSVTVLSTCQITDAASAVLEALGSESFRTVVPAYYETALKVKYSRDDETSRMLDMIRDSVKFDFAYIYNQSLGTPMAQFRKLVLTDAETAASTLAANMVVCNTKLDDMLNKYAEMK